MHNTSLHRIITAGVYVFAGGRFPFQVGLTKARTSLGVVRLGGHRENDETGWDCAVREAREEASITIHPLKPPATYWYESATFRTAPWPYSQDTNIPVVVTTRSQGRITPIYLAYTHDQPVPSSETSAILLLRMSDIAQIVSGAWTLGQYIAAGGIARVRRPLPSGLMLEPYPHLRLLHQLLTLHPDLFAAAPKR